jgi:hypothetical protein
MWSSLNLENGSISLVWDISAYASCPCIPPPFIGFDCSFSLYSVSSHHTNHKSDFNGVHFCFKSLSIVPTLLSYVIKMASFFVESTGTWIQNGTRASTGSWAWPNGEYRLTLLLLLVLCVCISWVKSMSVFILSFRVCVLSACTGNLQNHSLSNFSLSPLIFPYKYKLFAPWNKRSLVTGPTVSLCFRLTQWLSFSYSQMH